MSAMDEPQPCREKKPFLPDESDSFRLEMNRPESNKLAADSPGKPQNSSSTGPGHKEATSGPREESVWLRLQQALLLFRGISQHCTKCNLCIALITLLIGIGIGIRIGIGIGIGIPIGKGIEKENYTTPPTTASGKYELQAHGGR
ncbi:hypothetical protein XELAEV_18028297mg [Xenopus laevis]|uniref:Uncharacterized protein n=1 Tax=Xenopus laevis TaxID=8355 RepID=A0A974CZG0_XENLA|nr:hypothetical protein XELAEV_18028297mg [Xenopus laevis]